MSARNPHYCSPVSPRLVDCANGFPEDKVIDCIAMSLPIKLHKPDLNAGVQFEIIASGDEMRALKVRAMGRYYPGGVEAWKKCRAHLDRRSELWQLAAAARGTADYERRCIEACAHDGHDYGAKPKPWVFAPRPPGGWGSDTMPRTEGMQRHLFRMYGLSNLAIEVATNRGLKVDRVSMPDWDFVVVKVWATTQDFRAAQYEWLQKMIATQPRQQVSPATPTLDLFA